jgi:hypothetical protein
MLCTGVYQGAMAINNKRVPVPAPSSVVSEASTLNSSHGLHQDLKKFSVAHYFMYVHLIQLERGLDSTAAT